MKNQISVEYLGTFGWILLVVMVTILALAQFGVLDLSAQLPEECYLGEQIACKKHFLDENGNLVLTLQSNYNKEVTIKEINLEGYYIDVLNGCSSDKLVPREEVNIICEVTDAGGTPHVFIEDRQKFNVDLKIIPKDSPETFEIKGSIITDVLSADISTAFSCADLTSGVGEVTVFQWQCPGNILSSDDYLGENYCCDTSLVTDPCLDEISDGGVDGVCCGASTCNALSPINVNANLACQHYRGNTNFRCCTSCSTGNTGSGGPDVST